MAADKTGIWRRYICVFIAVLCLVSSGARAEPIPGADDPALRAAVSDWLAAENPKEDLWSIGEIAADGNIAARLIVRTLVYRYMPLRFPEMSRQELRALVPPDRTEAPNRFKYSTFLYRVDTSTIPAYEAQSSMTFAKSADDWIAGAETMLAAGLREEFMLQFGMTLTNRHLMPAVTVFADGVLEDSDHARSYVWFLRGLGRASIDLDDRFNPERAAERRARWGEPPWGEEQDRAFATALSEGRWSAIVALGMLITFDPDFLEFFEVPATSLRWATLSWAGFSGDLEDNPPPTEAEFDALGRLVMADAARSPYLLPLVNTCQTQCAAEVSHCVASGALLRVYDQGVNFPTRLEAVASAEDFYASDWAADGLLVSIGLRVRRGTLEENWLSLPQCLRENAAQAAEAHDTVRP